MPERAHDSAQRFLPRVPAAFVATPAARVPDALPPLVVLRAPRGFGKTSTVASWMRGVGARGRTVIWVTVPQRDVGPLELWRLIHDALVERELVDAVEEPGLRSVERALRRIVGEPVLVLDGLDEVSDEEVDSDLVRFVQTNPGLHLVALTRTERPIERMGPASVDSLVLRAPDLALDAAGVAELAERLGCPLASAEAEQVRRDVAGWPALARAVLLDASRADDGTLDLDLAGARRYATAVLHDHDSDRFYEFATGVAVPTSFTREEAVDLVGKDAVAQAFTRIYAAGLFHVTRSPGEDTRYAYTTFVRRLVASVLREDDRPRYRRLHRRVAGHRLAAGDGPAAFAHAVEAEDWDLAVAVAEQWWAELLAQHTDALHRAVHAMPEEVIVSSARLLVARDYILDEHTPQRAADVLRSGQLAPGGLLDGRPLTLTERLARRSGDGWSAASADIAAGLLDGARSGGTEPSGTWSPEVRRAVPELLLQWAISVLAEEDSVSAAFAFGQAVKRGREAGDQTAAREAAVGLSLALVVLGHLEAAEEWLAHARGLEAPESVLESFGTPIVESMISSMRLEPEALTVAARRFPAGLEPLKGFVSYVNGARALRTGGGLEAIAEIEAYRRVLDPSHRGLAGNITAAVLSDLYLVTGQLDRAAAVLRESSSSSVWLRVSRARYAMYVGAQREALRLSEGAASVAAVRPRLAMELSLVRACAALRSDQTQTAIEALHLATSLAQDTGLLLPFLYVPRSDLDAITESMPNARVFLARALPADGLGIFPEPLRSGELSEAELRVFEQLVGNRPLSYIAHKLFLSESTVKTHVRRIYRKLGVSSRADAVARARELSIIP
ncbi:LuxR C-terminal-related transcriptional regulator [Georgenia sp. MJ206]|uniref:LuxR C-terminal-related transcriptional regulator n=1 Tax=Georgenia wangjunii TaxID=3117730 RepID=UPI002F267BBC